MRRILTWKFLVPVCGLSAATPFILPTDIFGILLLLNTVFTCVGALYAVLFLKMRTRIPMILACMAGAVFIPMNVEWAVRGGATGEIGSVAASIGSGLFMAAGAALLVARRPKHYRDGLLDCFAALLGVGAIQWQWSGASGLSGLAGVAEVVLPISGAILFAGLLAVLFRLTFDKSQNQTVIRSIIVANVLEGVSALATDSWSDPSAPLWPYALSMGLSWFIVGAYVHPDLPRIFEPEPEYERRLDVMRWLGPASALIVSPAIVIALVVRSEAPSIPVAIASVLMTCVVIMRIGRLLRERETGRRELAIREQRFRSLVEHGSDVIAITDAYGLITHVSGGVAELMGIGPEQMLGRSVTQVLAEEHHPGVLRALANSAAPTATPGKDLRLKRPDNQVRWVSVRVTNHFDTPGIGGWVLNIHDNTDRKVAEDALSQMALYDSLTGLPNRVQMRDRLETVIKESPGTTALLFCDLDGFKQVNDIFGHEVGDEVLRAVAGRWSGLLRSSDILGRWGGDEFLVICPNMASVDDATEIGERLHRALGRPLATSIGTAQLGSSVGLTLHRPGESVNDLISRADGAMYAAKRARAGLQIV